jgi:hypothetical protein
LGSSDEPGGKISLDHLAYPSGDLIPATGLHYGLNVLTNNRQHVERVEGLQIESISRLSNLRQRHHRIARSGFFLRPIPTTRKNFITLHNQLPGRAFPSSCTDI